MRVRQSCDHDNYSQSQIWELDSHVIMVTQSQIWELVSPVIAIHHSQVPMGVQVMLSCIKLLIVM